MFTRAAVVVFTSFLFSWPAIAGTYYVATTGDNLNPGSEALPWKTLQYAVDRLGAGDTLRIRGGRYYENIYMNCAGTQGNPVVIEAYGDEEVVIDGSIAAYQNTTFPNNEWELVDSSIHLYRSVRTYNPLYYVAAWLVDVNGSGKDKQLVEYGDDEGFSYADWLSTTRYTEETGPVYCGPGVDMRADGKIYIRLQQNPDDLFDADGNPLPDIPSNKNPNYNKIAVFVRRANYCQIIRLTETSHHITFRNLRLFYNNMCVYTEAANSNITFENCAFKFRTYGIHMRNSTNVQIINCTFDNGFPEWTSWGDVKVANARPAYPELQSFGIYLGGSGAVIRNNEFYDTFDGILVVNGSSDFAIHDNYFYRIRDDAINTAPGVFNIDVHDNVIRHALEGFSMVCADSQSRGSVYVHHNIIDCSKLYFVMRPVQREYLSAWGWNRYGVVSPFGKHMNSSTDALGYWKIYNNTLIGRGNGNGYDDGGTNPHIQVDQNYYVYNNIFYNVDNRPVYSAHQESTGANYDGNMLWITPSGVPANDHLFDGFGVTPWDFHSLGDYVGNWEANGVQADPIFDLDAIASSVYAPLAEVRMFYRPLNYRVFGLGASYTGYTWPGLDRGQYKGVMAPVGGYWKLDETDPQYVQDSSANNDDGVIYGAVRVTDEGRQGLQFGNGHYVNCGNGSNVNLTNSITVAAWIKWSGKNNSYANRILEVGDKAIMLWVYGAAKGGYANRVGFGINGLNTGEWAVSSQAIPLDTWVHVAAVYDRQTMRVYVNGQPGVAVSQTAAMEASNASLVISDPSPDTSFNGIIDEVFICEDALSSEDIADLYAR